MSSAARVLGAGAALIAAAPAFGVCAMRVDGGYRLTGRWGYNSGAPNADWIAAAAPIFDGDQPRIGETGPELVIAFVPPAPEGIAGRTPRIREQSLLPGMPRFLSSAAYNEGSV